MCVCVCVCVCKDVLARYLIDLAPGTLLVHKTHSHRHTHTHTHLLILRPLSSINTFPLQITQQINHHGYSNIIIAVLEGSSDWWCLEGHLEIDNYRENMACTIHLAAEWTFKCLFDPQSRMECRKQSEKMWVSVNMRGVFVRLCVCVWASFSQLT